MSITLYFKSFVFAAIPAYCASPSANIPTLLNTASTPTPVQTMGSSTPYTCANGYASSGGGSTAPYYQCVSYMSGAGNGMWSNNSWSCERTPLSKCHSKKIH